MLLKYLFLLVCMAPITRATSHCWVQGKLAAQISIYSTTKDRLEDCEVLAMQTQYTFSAVTYKTSSRECWFATTLGYYEVGDEYWYATRDCLHSEEDPSPTEEDNTSLRCDRPRDKAAENDYRHWIHDDGGYISDHADSGGYANNSLVELECKEGYYFQEDEGNVLSKWLTCNDGVWFDGQKKWDTSDKCIHATACSYPHNVLVYNYTAETYNSTEPEERYYLGETATLKCKGELKLFTEEEEEIRQEAEASITVTCPDNERNVYCGIEVQAQVELGDAVEYVDSKKSVILGDKTVATAAVVYSAVQRADMFPTARNSYKFFEYSDIRFQYLNVTMTLLQLHLLVIPPHYNDTTRDVTRSSVEEDIRRDFNRATGVEVAGLAEKIIINKIQYVPDDTCGGFTETTNKGTYSWNSTAKDEQQDISCSNNNNTNNNTATAMCGCDDVETCLLVLTPDYSSCPFKGKTAEIDEIRNSNKSGFDKSEELKNITQNITEENIDEDGYDIGADTIEDILADVESKEDNETRKEEANENVLDVIDKFANAGNVVAYKESKATEKYLDALQTVIKNIKLEEATRNIVKTNLRVALMEIDKSETNSITLTASDDGVKISNTATDNSDIELSETDEIVMKIPQQITESLKDTNRFYFVVFSKPTFFTTEQLFTGEEKLQSAVFSAGVAGQDNIVGIEPPIQFTMSRTNSTANNKSECVFWQDSADATDRVLSREGMVTVESGRQQVTCQTTHLTSFAILMSSEALPDIHNDILESITYIGCSLSIIGLIMSLIGLSVFRAIRKPVATKVHINMSAALLCANIVFTVGIDQTDKPMFCLATGLLCHYFFLAAVLWMGVEGFHLYVMIVRVFGHLSNRFLMKCAVFAWGFPLVVIAATLAWTPDNYQTTEFCWLAKIPMIAMFMCPIMVVILINSYMFVKVVQEITKSQNRLKTNNMPANCGAGFDVREKMVKVRAAVSVMVLLGLTWILGPAMLLDMVPGFSLVIQYLFTVCNSLQGFLFFFFHCAIKSDVKERWKTYLGFEMSQNMQSDFKFTRTYDQNGVKSNQPHHKTTEFSKLGDSATSLNKSLISFKPKFNRVRPDSPEDDSDLAIVEF